MKRLLMVAVTISLFAGCVSMGRKIDQNAIDQIKKGETTKQQVVELIGSPDRITTPGDGSAMFHYSFVRVASKPTTFVPVVGMFAGGAKTQSQILVVTFGPDEIVKNVMNSYSADDVSTGLTTGSKASIDDVEKNKRPK